MSDIQQLIDDLGSKSGSARHGARRALVRQGAAAVDPLVGALNSPNHYTRWGAAKALGQIKDPASATALVGALEDEETDVRWLAAQALYKLGEPGLSALLGALATGTMQLHHHHAAHHVLHDFADAGRDDVAPVLEALEGSSPTTATPIAAAAVLNSLQI